MAGRMIKVISARIQTGADKAYANPVKQTKSLKYWKRKVRIREPPKFEHFEGNFWTQNASFYLYFMLLGNGIDGLPQSLRFVLNMSGGVFILFAFVFTVILTLPMLYAELFLGRYTGLSNSQMYRMSPIFFGFCMLGLVMDTCYIAAQFPEMSMSLIGAMKLILDPEPKCPDGQAMCYDYQTQGKLNASCRYQNSLLNCTGKSTPITYVISYFWFKEFRDIENFEPNWKLIIATSLTWLTILALANLKMRLLQLILKIVFIIDMVIMAVIFIMALSSKGSANGLFHFTQFKIKKITLHGTILTAFFIPLKNSLVHGGGFMTCSANFKFDSKIGVATNAVMLSVVNTAYNIYKLAILHTILGVLQVAMGLSSNEDVYLPFVGLYYALIPEFLRFRASPNIFSVFYHLSTWMLEVVKITLMTRMQILSLCDVFPKIVQFQTHTKLTFVTFQGIIGLISTIGLWVKLLAHLNWISNLYIMSGLLLLFKSLLLFCSYSVGRLCDDIHFCNGKQPVKIWSFFWYLYPWIIFFFLATLVINCFDPIDPTKNPLKFFGNDLIKHDFTKNAFFLGVAKGCIILLTMFIISFLYIVFLIRSTKRINLITPLFFWGPPIKEERIARKAFKPWQAVRSREPKIEKTRFRVNSIKQQHERDAAQKKMKGRVFLDLDFFENIGNKSKKKDQTKAVQISRTTLTKHYEFDIEEGSAIKIVQ